MTILWDWMGKIRYWIQTTAVLSWYILKAVINEKCLELVNQKMSSSIRTTLDLMLLYRSGRYWYSLSGMSSLHLPYSPDLHQVHVNLDNFQVKARQTGKLAQIKEKHKSSNEPHHGLVRAVVNIISWQSSPSKKSLLNKGLNFITTIRHVPILTWELRLRRLQWKLQRPKPMS